MKKTTKLVVNKFSNIPPLNTLEQGVLYLSGEYDTAIHLCPCGCKQEVVTPFDFQGWKYEINKEDRSLISIRPSILNPGCDTHYYITNGEIEFL